jgi:site-specific DNA recombinase
MTSRAVIYARISEDEPNYDKPAVQTRSLRKFADENGYEVVAEFEDRVSAFANPQGELKERPGFSALMAGIASEQYDFVLAAAPDRLSRDVLVGEAFKALCRRHNVKIHTRHGGLVDPNDPQQRAMATIMDAISQMDVAARMKKQSDKFEDEVMSGRPLWGVRPFGFSSDPNTLPNRNGKVSQRWTVHNEYEAELLRNAYRTILHGGTIYSILKRWNEAGVLTTRGKPWSYASVQTLLKRPRNAGIQVWRGNVLPNVEVRWAPIVDRETFDSVLAILSDPGRKTTPGTKPRHLLSSIARCHCGAVMRSSTGNGEPIYKCATKMNAQNFGIRHACIATRLVDGRVREAVVTALLSAPLDRLPIDSEEEPDEVLLIVELARLRAANAEIRAMVADGGATYAQVAKDLNANNSRVAALEAERDIRIRVSAESALFNSALADVVPNWSKIKEARSKLKGEIDWDDAIEAKALLSAGFDALDLDMKRELVRRLLVITVASGRSPSRVTIEDRDRDDYGVEGDEAMPRRDRELSQEG